MSNILFGLAFDVADAVAQAVSWAQATGGDVEDGATQDEAVVTGRVFPRLAFHRVPGAKTAKNRLHIDLMAREYEPELDRLLALGASKVNEMTPGDARWTTMADRGQRVRCHRRLIRTPARLTGTPPTQTYSGDEHMRSLDAHHD